MVDVLRAHRGQFLMCSHLDSHELPCQLVEASIDLAVRTLPEQLPPCPQNVARLDLDAPIKHLRSLVLQGNRIEAKARRGALGEVLRHGAANPENAKTNQQTGLPKAAARLRIREGALRARGATAASSTPPGTHADLFGLLIPEPGLPLRWARPASPPEPGGAVMACASNGLGCAPPTRGVEAFRGGLPYIFGGWGVNAWASSLGEMDVGLAQRARGGASWRP